MIKPILQALCALALIVFIVSVLSLTNMKMRTETIKQMTADEELANAQEERALTKLQLENEQVRAELYEALKK